MTTEPSDNAERVALPAGVVFTSPWRRLGSVLLEFVLTVVTLWIGWVVWALLIAENGQTPAKKLLGIRVIRVDTLQPVGLGRMFWLRYVLGGLVAAFVFPLTLFILVFMPFWDRHNQTVYEKVSGTYVVDDPQNAWNR